MKFRHFWPPLQRSFWLPMKNPLLASPWKNPSEPDAHAVNANFQWKLLLFYSSMVKSLFSCSMVHKITVKGGSGCSRHTLNCIVSFECILWSALVEIVLYDWWITRH